MMPNINNYLLDWWRVLRFSFSRNKLKSLMKNPRLWLTIAVMVLTTIPQYSSSIGIPDHLFPWRLIQFHRYTIERIFYLIPIVYSAITISVGAGIFFACTSLVCMLPRALLISPSLFDALFESLMVIALGIFFCLFLKSHMALRKQKDHELIELNSMQENLKFYLKQAVMAQEDERKRISRELHDDTVQVLTGLSREMDNFIRENRTLSKKDIRLLKDFLERLNTGAKEVQRFSQDLRPSLLDYLGLLTAVRSLIDELQDRHGLNVDFRVSGSERRLSPEVEILVFRIIQEALSNVGKHANANEVVVKADFLDDKTVFSLSDDGKGFDVPESLSNLTHRGKLGLAGMQERAQLLNGTFSLHSEKGKGTTISIEIPC